MFQLPITTDKIYLLFAVLGLAAIFILGSWYVKSCVKGEINDLKKDNRRKKEQQYNKQQELLQERQHQNAEIQNEHVQDEDIDSYVDPVGREHDTHQQYQDLNVEYKSPADGEEADPKDSILMRDIMDNKGHN